MSNITQLHLGACIVGGKLYATVMDRDARGHITVVATAEIDAAMLHESDCLATMRPVQQWQPIETAPTDGTEFWAYRAGDGKQAVAYRVPRDDCEMWSFGGTTAAVEFAPWIKPTHWMSKPADPVA